MRNLLFWSLVPLTLPQALYVRHTAPRFAPPACDPRGETGQRMRSFDRAARRIAFVCDAVVHLPVDFETTAGSFSDDGFHPSETSYAWFGRAIAGRLVSELLPRLSIPGPRP